MTQEVMAKTAVEKQWLLNRQNEIVKKANARLVDFTAKHEPVGKPLLYGGTASDEAAQRPHSVDLIQNLNNR